MVHLNDLIRSCQERGHGSLRFFQETHVGLDDAPWPYRFRDLSTGELHQGKELEPAGSGIDPRLLNGPDHELLELYQGMARFERAFVVVFQVQRQDAEAIYGVNEAGYQMRLQAPMPSGRR